jgi:hypothetical protein
MECPERADVEVTQQVTQMFPPSRAEVEASIRDAFASVRLGRGTSLRQAEAIDKSVGAVSEAGFRTLPASEVTDDWATVPTRELDRDCIAYLDAEGLRYYLPALMLRLLDEYDEDTAGEMWTIGTIMALDQRRGHPVGFLELLTPAQRIAIARYVKALPELVELSRDDAIAAARAVRDVWSKYLPPDS